MMGKNEQNNNLDFKSIILRLWQFRWYFLVFIALCTAFTYFYNKFSQNTYKNTIQLSIDIQEGQNARNKDEQFQSIDIPQGPSKLENELEKMKSFPLVKRTLTQLDYQVSYYIRKNPFETGPLKNLPYRINKELYKNAPFKIHFAKSHNQIIDTKFFVTFLNDSTYWLKAQKRNAYSYNYIDNQVKAKNINLNVNNAYKFGEMVKTDHFKFYIERNESDKPISKKSNYYYFTFNHMDYLTSHYLNNLTIEPVSPTASVINISITGTHKQKVTEFLNHLSQVYINKDLQEKNRKAKSTINFIESQISDVSSSLTSTGSSLEQFRSRHQIVDLDFQGKKMYKTLNQLKDKKSSLKTQRKYYIQIRNYINNNKVSELMAPSSMNFSDPVLNKLISQLTELNSERINTSENKENLYRNQINEKIENLKKSILENVNTSLKNIQISLEDINYRINNISNELSSLPATELKLQTLKRKFELNDEIYTYLLTKRAEAQLAQASNFPSYQIVDPARKLDSKIISPRRTLNYLIAIILGLVLPGSVILLSDFFNTRIKTSSDIESITDIPVLGNIMRTSEKRSALNLKDISSSLTSESVRMLRTNLQVLNGKKNQAFLVSSSRSGEGKTFVSIKLAKSFAMLEKKVILVGFDLRKPKLGNLLNVSNKKGLSNFLAGAEKINDVIQHTENNYLDVITEGPLPPNPNELIASSRSNSLIQYLRSVYDYIIIDTSPVGIVSDSKLIMNNTDINILVARQSKTKKNELFYTLKSLQNQHNANANFYIVINDFSPKNEQYNYMYQYYYHKPTKKKRDKSQKNLMET